MLRTRDVHGVLRARATLHRHPLRTTVRIVLNHALAALIELVADHTDAERIHVLSWSAGARVTMTALGGLRELPGEVGSSSAHQSS